MRSFVLGLLIVVSGSAVEAAKCTGSPSCRACKNCSSCTYCKGGGSCGVCSPSKGTSVGKADLEEEQATSPPPRPRGDCCSRVIDGSTIEVRKADGVKVVVRLLGVGAPVNAPGPAVEPVHSLMCANFVEELLLDEEVRIVPESPNAKDRGGNMLAYVYKIPGGVLVNEEVIAAGYADVSSEYPFKREERFRLDREAARSGSRGIWGLLKMADDGRKVLLRRADDERKRQFRANQKVAASWMAIGAKLEGRNAVAAISWYQKVLDKYPDVPAAAEAREKLKSRKAPSPKK
jgi:endonuclease YncB( thermonuclease family)